MAIDAFMLPDNWPIPFWWQISCLENHYFSRNGQPFKEKILKGRLWEDFFFKNSTSSYLNESLTFADGRVIILYSGWCLDCLVLSVVFIYICLFVENNFLTW